MQCKSLWIKASAKCVNVNVYGSIPHKLVEVALERYHVPQKVKELLLDYYNKFSLRVSAGTLSSDWHIYTHIFYIKKKIMNHYNY